MIIAEGIILKGTYSEVKEKLNGQPFEKMGLVMLSEAAKAIAEPRMK